MVLLAFKRYPANNKQFYVFDIEVIIEEKQEYDARVSYGYECRRTSHFATQTYSDRIRKAKLESFEHCEMKHIQYVCLYMNVCLVYGCEEKRLAVSLTWNEKH